ncbi:hypothetical protein KFK09_019298 [Dendrobium nobile]|uniref:Uncharacterized protein n=1 Tax=Dendrobium nobile TaxID=94219 RepID=A0A8T3AY75_DENNO|nr:hypothetical protein KFK09_019298 [Dendrobium nobile]
MKFRKLVELYQFVGLGASAAEDTAADGTPELSSQGPILTTRTPAHAASRQPHPYVTPFSPQTGSYRKQLIGQAMLPSSGTGHGLSFP